MAVRAPGREKGNRGYKNTRLRHHGLWLLMHFTKGNREQCEHASTHRVHPPRSMAARAPHRRATKGSIKTLTGHTHTHMYMYSHIQRSMAAHACLLHASLSLWLSCVRAPVLLSPHPPMALPRPWTLSRLSMASHFSRVASPSMTHTRFAPRRYSLQTRKNRFRRYGFSTAFARPWGHVREHTCVHVSIFYFPAKLNTIISSLPSVKTARNHSGEHVSATHVHRVQSCPLVQLGILPSCQSYVLTQLIHPIAPTGAAQRISIRLWDFINTRHYTLVHDFCFFKPFPIYMYRVIQHISQRHNKPYTKKNRKKDPHPCIYCLVLPL